MQHENRTEYERGRLAAARARGPAAKLATYAALSGPGWLQSAITLGGGSLAGSLYLGVLGGTSLLWLQPLAMAIGVVMLSAISHVTLSTGEPPFRAINRHVNPVLGWGWALASLVASIVWCLPQFSLGTAAVQQNLLPGLPADRGAAIACALILVAAVSVVWMYDRGSRGIKAFELVLKAMVGLIVVSFFGVVVVLAQRGGLDWPAVAAGFVPDPSLLWAPAASLREMLAAVPEPARGHWQAVVVSDQRQVMVTAAATAVGINMTFLLPYSMRARGWDREFRGLAVFDLATGLFLPFVLATSCVVLAAGARFHAQPDDALLARQTPSSSAAASYDRLLAARLGVADATPAQLDALPEAERRLASVLVRRDAFDLATALTPLTGAGVARTVFGIGVLAMAISTVIVLMLIAGFCICEMLGIEPRGRPRRWASMVPAVGVLGPFVWSGDAQFWLAVPTSVFGFTLLPIAYWTFFLMLNNARLLGADRPVGALRWGWNVAMLVGLALVSVGAAWAVWNQAGWFGAGAALAFLCAAAVAHRRRPR